MSRGKWTWDTEKGCLVPVEKPQPLSAPEVMPDEMEPMQSMVDCRYYTSRSAYRKHLKSRGYIEIGNEINFQYKHNPYEEYAYNKQLEEDCARAYFEARDGFAELDEIDKERCKRIDRQNKKYSYDRRPRDRNGKPL